MILLLCPKCERTIFLNKLLAHSQACLGNRHELVHRMARDFQDFLEHLHETAEGVAVSCPFCDQALSLLQFNRRGPIQSISWKALKTHALVVQLHHARVYHEKTPEEVREALKK